jgi:hypothetical protein
MSEAGDREIAWRTSLNQREEVCSYFVLASKMLGKPQHKHTLESNSEKATRNQMGVEKDDTSQMNKKAKGGEGGIRIGAGAGNKAGALQ